MTRRLMPVTRLARLRTEHEHLLAILRDGNVPMNGQLGSYANDVEQLRTAYEVATDRLRTAARVLDGEP